MLYDDWLDGGSIYGKHLEGGGDEGSLIKYGEGDEGSSGSSEDSKSLSYADSSSGLKVTAWADAERAMGRGGDVRLATSEERAVEKLRQALGNEKEVERITNIFGSRVATFHIHTLAFASMWLRSGMATKDLEKFCRENSVNPPDLVRYIAILQASGF